MRLFNKNKKGQNIAEYAILIALVIAAAIGIQTYVKRGLQARMKADSDGLVACLEATYGTAQLQVPITACALNQYEELSYTRYGNTQIIEDSAATQRATAGTQSRNFVTTTCVAGVVETHNYVENP